MHTTASKPQLIALATFTAAYMIAAAVGAVIVGNKEFVFYIVVMLLLIAITAGVHFRMYFSAGVLWLLTIWGAMHMAGGLLPVPESWPINGDQRVLYSWWIVPKSGEGGWLKYDQVVHFYGFGVAAWVCWQALARVVAPARPRLWSAIFATLAAIGLGAINEVVEFAAQMTLPETNVGGYVNTGWDLVFNMAGATTVGLALYLSTLWRAGEEALNDEIAQTEHLER